LRYRLKVVCVVALVAATAFAGAVFATPISGVTSTVFAVGRFDEIDARARTGHWRARIQTNSPTDVHVLENRIAPGGTFGWHSHPGPSFVVVTSGTLTLYRGDDPHCTPSLVQAGSGFVDNGTTSTSSATRAAWRRWCTSPRLCLRARCAGSTSRRPATAPSDARWGSCLGGSPT